MTDALNIMPGFRCDFIQWLQFIQSLNGSRPSNDCTRAYVISDEERINSLIYSDSIYKVRNCRRLVPHYHSF